jgi:response regulator NasT
MENTITKVLRVAVADDEPVMQMYLEETVALLGHEVVAVAKDGAELVEMCLQTRPDLIVTDIRMPKFDGYEAVARICSQSTLPVVFVSGFNESARAETVESCCVANYLTKPIDEAQLDRGIATVLARFNRYRLVRQGAVDNQDALSKYKRVQRALDHLLRREGLKETEAFADTQGIPLPEAADRIMNGASN